MRLTNFSRLLIVVAVVAAAYFGFRMLAPKFQQSTGDNQPATEQQEAQTPTTAEEEPAPAPSENRPATRSFDYTPAEPVNGKLKGVVELGASGFNSFVIRVDNAKNWQLDKAEYGVSLVYENMATEDDVRIGLKQYISKMLDRGVSPKDIHFVVSSGAAKSEAVGKIKAGLKSMGYVVNTVTPAQEGKLALQCVLPRDFEDNAFVVDIGSANTKISWMENGKINSIESFGSKYFQSNVNDNTVYNDVSRAVMKIPAANRQTCFIIGGIPFELAKQSRQGKERFTVLAEAGDYTADGDKQKAGLNIYKAISDATDCETFVFDWDANFTIGFLLSL